MIFILTEFIGIKTAIKEIILQLIVMIFFIVVIKTYLAFIWNYKNKKMMQCLIQIKSLNCLTQIQVNTLDSTVNFWLEGTIFLHKSVNREENMFSLKPSRVWSSCYYNMLTVLEF